MTIDQRLAHGMARVPRLPDVQMADAGAEMRALYRDIECTLRVPFVNFVFRTLANFPYYFQPAWQALAPHLRTRGFERAADRLRAAAAEDLAVEAIAADALVGADRQAVAAFTDSIHYVLPKLLLIATAFDLQLDGQATGSAAPDDGAAERIDYGVADGTHLLALVDPAQASARVKALFTDIRRVHGHPGVASYYRGLANFPAFLDTVWARVHWHISTEAYAQRKQTVLKLAETIATDRLLYKAAVVQAPERDDIAAVLAVFRYRVIPDILLDVALIKAMLDGAEAALVSRFSDA